MHTAKRGRRCAALAVCGALLLAGMLPGLPAAALDGFSKGRLSIITEPGAVSDKVSFYKDGKEQGASAMTWVDGRDGMALLLDGKTEYLQLGYAQLKTNRFSFSTWIKWLGAPDGAEEDARYNQRLFTYSRREERWLAFSPFARDASKQKEGGSLNGIYLDLGFNKTKTQEGMHFEQFNPAADGVSYGLPEGSWHHVAVVSDEHSMKVYIDGTLWFDDPLLMSMVELQALTMKIGAAYDGGRCLHAELDDTALYEVALTADQIGMMAGGVDPFADGASMPPSTAPYIPTAPAPVSSEVSGTGDEDDRPATVFGFPVAGLVIMGGVVVVFAGLSILLSVRASKNNGGPKGGGRA